MFLLSVRYSRVTLSKKPQSVLKINCKIYKINLVQRRSCGVVGYSIIGLSRFFHKMCQEIYFENRWIMAKTLTKVLADFFDPLCVHVITWHIWGKYICRVSGDIILWISRDVAERETFVEGFRQHVLTVVQMWRLVWSFTPRSLCCRYSSNRISNAQEINKSRAELTVVS